MRFYPFLEKVPEKSAVKSGIYKRHIFLKMLKKADTLELAECAARA